MLPVLIVFVAGIGVSLGTDCPNYWTAYDNSCYWFGTENPSTFVEAEHFCQHNGGHLVQVDSPAENTFLTNYLRENKHGSSWMGLTDVMSEGVWVWQATNTAPEFTDWAPWQPDDAGHHEDSARFQAEYGYKWNDGQCSAILEPLCERTPHSPIVG